MDLGIKNKVALVTASSTGLGKEVAVCLAQEKTRLTICARTSGPLLETAELLKGLGAQVLSQTCDLTDEKQVNDLVDKTVSHYGGLDILVVNCGGPPAGQFLDHTVETWRAAVELNLMSTIFLCRAAAKHMLEKKWGRIVLMTSISVKQPIDGLILSNSVRAAVVGLGKSLASEFGPQGVLVNSVCPGYFHTKRVDSLAQKLAAASGGQPQDLIDKWSEATVLKRIGDPAEFGPLVAFLCSEKAAYMTGTAIAIDGGMSRGLL